MPVIPADFKTRDAALKFLKFAATHAETETGPATAFAVAASEIEWLRGVMGAMRLVAQEFLDDADDYTHSCGKQILAILNETGKAAQMNRLPNAKKDLAMKLLAEGFGIRMTANEVGAHRDTIMRLAQTISDRKCKCGKPATHPGWCNFRFARSPMRQMFMRQKWLRGQYKLPCEKQSAARSITAIILGDPEPGRSAFDRKYGPHQ